MRARGVTAVRARNTGASWGWVARLLHWGMAGLILFQLWLGVSMTHFTPDLIERFRLTQVHKSWGFVIFALALARLAWRLGGAAPAPPPGAPVWRIRAAAANHRALYALMLALPLSGWAMASASPTQDLLGMQNLVFGWFALPDPWVPGSASAERVARLVHVGAAVALALVLAAHVAAALWHRLVIRDDVLERMTLGR